MSFESRIEEDTEYEFLTLKDGFIHKCKAYDLFDDDFSVVIPKIFNSFAVLHYNVRDLAAGTRFVDIVNDLELLPFKVPILCMSETWHSHGREAFFAIDGYNCVSESRINRKGGGVSMYYAKHLEFVDSYSYSNTAETIQTVAVIVKIKGIIINIMLRYNADGSNESLDNPISRFWILQTHRYYN
jgi:hypothetical protein